MQARGSQLGSLSVPGVPGAGPLTFSVNWTVMSFLGLNKSLDLDLCVVTTVVSSRPIQGKLVHPSVSLRPRSSNLYEHRREKQVWGPFA